MNILRPTFIKGKATEYKQIAINYIVYEKNDDGLLLECEITQNSHTYLTNICIDFFELNRIIGWLSGSQNPVNLHELISENIIDNTNAICELDIRKELGQPLLLNDYSFDSTYHLMRA